MLPKANHHAKRRTQTTFQCFGWKCASRRRTMASIVMFNFHFQLNRSCKIIVIIIWYRTASPFISFRFTFKSRTFRLCFDTCVSWTPLHHILRLMSMPFFPPFFFLFSISKYLITVSVGMLIMAGGTERNVPVGDITRCQSVWCAQIKYTNL